MSAPTPPDLGEMLRDADLSDGYTTRGATRNERWLNRGQAGSQMSGHVRELCAEVERLRRERDTFRSAFLYNYVSHKLAEGVDREQADAMADAVAASLRRSAGLDA